MCVSRRGFQLDNGFFQIFKHAFLSVAFVKKPVYSVVVTRFFFMFYTNPSPTFLLFVTILLRPAIEIYDRYETLSSVVKNVSLT